VLKAFGETDFFVRRDTDQCIHRAATFKTDPQLEYDDGAERIWEHLSPRDTCFLRDDGSDEIDVGARSVAAQVRPPCPQTGGHALLLFARRLTERTGRRAAGRHEKAAARRDSS
jgi:hypothetical protein